MDKYTLKARIYPAIIVMVPMLVLYNLAFDEQLRKFTDNILSVKLVGSIGLSAVLMYFLAQANRVISKFVFEKALFRNERHFPTTSFLLYSDGELSKAYKEKIRAKIEADFSMTLPDRAAEEEDSEGTRKMLADAVGLVRSKVGSPKLLLQHNIEYGFVRNLIGGSVFGFAVAGVGTVLFIEPQWAHYLLIGLAVAYGLLLLFGRWLMRMFGGLYAKRLFNSYISGEE